MLPSETMIWQPEFTDKTLSRKPGAVHCEKILTPTEWKLLWVKLEGKQLPAQTPTLKWACLKLAKLGRW
ncbi:hypothetical protein F7F61_27840, partial [Escherichia coli]